MDDDTIEEIIAAGGEPIDVIVLVVTPMDLFWADMRAYRAPDGRLLLDAPAGCEGESAGP